MYQLDAALELARERAGRTTSGGAGGDTGGGLSDAEIADMLRVGTLRGHDKYITCIAVWGDAYVVSGSADATMKVRLQRQGASVQLTHMLSVL